ncbi:MAG TPA: kelch repeat-containing protein [Planctomycetota bacterium]|nr:kelch repeat-containing protein [Planctomycetota bacterium]
MSLTRALSLCLALAPAALASAPAAAGEKFQWPLSTKVEGELKANEWVKVESHGAARRYGGALFWLPAEKSFVLAMGAVGNWDDHGPFCYDEQTFSLEERLWKNRFPEGKGWKPEIGPCDAPKLPSHGYRLKDGRLGLWEGGFVAYFQYAVDTDRNKLVAYTHNRLVEYDPAARAWKELGPGTPSGEAHKLWWGSLCYDAHNKEFLLFGGNNGPGEFNDTRTWAYSVSGNAWKRIDPAAEPVKGFEARAEALRLEAVALHGAHSNRHFRTGLPADEKAGLAEAGKKLAAGIAGLKKDLDGKGTGYAKTHCERAAADLATAEGLAGRLGDAASPESIKTALELSRVLWRARTALMSEPPPRAHSQMVYDPATKSIVLFGGDRLDMLYGDTWVYDCATRTWQERRPDPAPSPRAGHAFLRLPEGGKLVLLGGYKFFSDTGYWGALYQQLPMQAWTYDVAADKWALVKDWGKPYPAFMSSKGAGFVAAAGAGDVVLTFGGERLGERGTAVTLACKLDPAQSDAAALAKAGAKPGAVEWRTGPYDPDWYLDGGAPDEAGFQAKLQGLPANTWTLLTPKEVRLPRQNRDWGTAVYDPDRQAIYRWSGGHSAHCGSDIPVFSMRTGRYHLKYPPAFPLDGIGSCGSQPSRGTFLGQPWISAHTYHSYAYDPVSRRMICCGHESFSYAYDPETGLWSHKPQPKGMREDNFYQLTLCATPAGPYAWTRFGTLFKYDGTKAEWSEVKVSGEKLPGTACDESSMCYDSKRDRLILVGKSLAGNVIAVDLKTAAASKLAPKGMAGAAAGGVFWRECVYDGANDVVVVTVGAKDKPWPVYDCEKNAWVALKLTGSPGFGCSNGLMYDPARKLLLGVDTNSVVHALRLDPKSAEPKDLE